MSDERGLKSSTTSLPFFIEYLPRESLLRQPPLLSGCNHVDSSHHPMKLPKIAIYIAIPHLPKAWGSESQEGATVVFSPTLRQSPSRFLYNITHQTAPPGIIHAYVQLRRWHKRRQYRSWHQSSRMMDGRAAQVMVIG